MRKIIVFLLSVLLFGSLGQPDASAAAAAKKYLVALIDFADETPNKMALAPGERPEASEVRLSEVMGIIRKLTGDSGLFRLLPPEAVAEGMGTQTGRDAAARRFDRFSSVRLGRALGVDAILTGEIVQFEKNLLEGNVKISGIDISNRVEDVVIKARLINAHNGEVIARAEGAGTADESVLETVGASVGNKLSAGFVEALEESVIIVLDKFRSANVRIDNSPSAALPADDGSFTVTKAEEQGRYVYIDAGRDSGISIADLFTILKDDGAGNFVPVPAAVYRAVKVEMNSARLELAGPSEAAAIIRPGDRARHRRGAGDGQPDSSARSETDIRFEILKNQIKR